MQSIYGALSAYLVIGLMFAACYSAIQHLGAGHFFAGGEPANTQTFQYFSFTTLTTLGYGDFTAAGNGSRAIAVMEALTGQVFLATLVARLVAAYRSPAEPKNEPGNPPPSRFPPRGVRNGTRMINGRIRWEAPDGPCTSGLLTAAVSMDRTSGPLLRSRAEPRAGVSAGPLAAFRLAGMERAWPRRRRPPLPPRWPAA